MVLTAWERCDFTAACKPVMIAIYPNDLAHRKKETNEQNLAIYDAKTVSEVVDCAITQGAQIVTRRGKKVVVIMSFEEYDHLQRQNAVLRNFSGISLSGSKLNIVRNRASFAPSR